MHENMLQSTFSVACKALKKAYYPCTEKKVGSNILLHDQTGDSI